MAKKKAEKKATPKATKRKGKQTARGATAQMKRLAGVKGNE